jgi:hypothetical protein
LRFARRHTLRGALFAGFDDVLQGGEGGRDAALGAGAGSAAGPWKSARARRCSSTASVCLHSSVRCFASAQGHSGARA